MYQVCPHWCQSVRSFLKTAYPSELILGGVFGEFEDAFLRFFNKSDWHALLHNSGTNAIHALYLAAGIKTGDEVIVPVYTFRATCSPLMQLGAVPVFVDYLPDGTIDPLTMVERISSKTKAVRVGHMWGILCDMHRISSTCKDNSLILLEDCSHAHEATLGDEIVGTFGNGAKPFTSTKQKNYSS